MPRRGRFGDFDLHEQLAVGGMGELYVATRVGAPRRPLALKILLSAYEDRADFVAMFEDEARVGMTLAHRNIVGVYEIGKFEGTPFIVMEYVLGENLRAVLRKMATHGERVPPELVVRIGIDVALGLDHAHRARDAKGNALHLVHRDLSPDNILLSYTGEVKILDFGIAKSEGRLAKTEYGVFKGKGQYMAPEQARGEPVDGRSDLFALALVLMETLTGVKRFENADGMQQIMMAREWEPQGPSSIVEGLPVELDAILLKALQSDPDRRFQTADEFAAALTRFLRGDSLATGGPGIEAMLRRLFPDADERPFATPRARPQDEKTLIRPRWEGDDEDDRKATAVRPALNLALEIDEDDDTRTASRDRDTRDRDTIPPSAAPRRFDEKTDGGLEPTVFADEPPPRARDRDEVPTRGGRDPVPAPLVRTPKMRNATPLDPAWARPGEREKTQLGDLPTAGDMQIPRRGGAKPRRFRPIRFLFFFSVLIACAIAASFTWRSRLPPPIRDPLDRVAAQPGVARVFDTTEQIAYVTTLRMGLLGPTPTPTPVPEVVIVKPKPALTLSSAATAVVAGSASPAASASPTAVVEASKTPAPRPTATKKGKDPVAKVAIIDLVSTPSGLEITIDGARSGKKTPATLRLPPGDHLLSIEAAGYRPWSFGEQFKAGDTMRLEAELHAQ